MALARSAGMTLDVAQLPAACKTLILTGTEDAVSPPTVCSAYAQIIKSSEVKVLDDVAHWHLFEDAKGFSDFVYTLLGVA